MKISRVNLNLTALNSSGGVARSRRVAEVYHSAAFALDIVPCSRLMAARAQTRCPQAGSNKQACNDMLESYGRGYGVNARLSML